MMAGAVVFVATPMIAYLTGHGRWWWRIALFSAALAVYFLVHEFLGVVPP